MTERHDSNLPPDAQPWGRDIERDIDALAAALAEPNQVDDRLEVQIGKLIAAQARFQYELEHLYTETGTPYPPQDAPPPPEVPPAPVVRVFERGADWSRTWGTSSFYTGGGEYTNATYLYQGSAPENKVGMWHFDTAPIIGKQIIAAEMFLSNVNTPWQPTVVAGFGTHSNASPPAGKPGGRINPFDVGWARGESKWFALPSGLYGGLSNGSIMGFTVGPVGPSDANSAFWRGVGQPSAPILKVSYYE